MAERGKLSSFAAPRRKYIQGYRIADFGALFSTIVLPPASQSGKSALEVPGSQAGTLRDPHEAEAGTDRREFLKKCAAGAMLAGGTHRLPAFFSTREKTKVVVRRVIRFSAERVQVWTPAGF